MTNGEKLLNVFPSLQIVRKDEYIVVTPCLDSHNSMQIWLRDWWDSEYIEQEPTIDKIRVEIEELNPTTQTLKDILSRTSH